MPDNELLKLTIAELASKIRSKEVSPVDVTEAALARANQLQPKLNSFITILGDEAMAQAREQQEAIARGEYLGPLQGIPIGIKDNIATRSISTTVGSRFLADNVLEEDAHVIKLCKAAGAIILGKENLEEFAAGVTSNNPFYGAVHNPWALEHIPGGSSGGGGANVAACVTFASLGTDLGGSVRLPGTFCGVVGMKQTYGRVSQRGLLATSYNGDHIGPLTRSVGDNALVLQAIAGYDPLDPSTIPVPVPDYTADLRRSLVGLKMGISADYYLDPNMMDPEVGSIVGQAIATLKELGLESRDVTLPSMEHAGALRIVSTVDSLITHEPYIEAHREDYGPDTINRTLAGQFILARDYSKALKVQRLVKEDHVRVLQQVDVLVSPTSPIPAPRIGEVSFILGGKEHRIRGPGFGMVSRYTSPSNATGLPAITVPCGFTQSGLPVGIQLIGRPFDEALLFRVAHAYEAVSPTRDRMPELVR